MAGNVEYIKIREPLKLCSDLISTSQSATIHTIYRFLQAK